MWVKWGKIMGGGPGAGVHFRVWTCFGSEFGCAYFRWFVVHILGLGICGYGCGYGVDNLCIYFIYIGFWGFLGIDRNANLRPLKIC
jgi:hypothetical protein